MIAEREGKDARVKQANAELRQANQRLKEMANQDGLTGVANRRFFDQSMAKEWARAIREKTPVAIGMVDIDRFKQFNDTYGHQKGDHCLRQVALALKRGVRRPADLVARYGGEEFVVLLPGTDLAGMDRVARKMQANVADLEIPHAASPTGRVSFSMGIAAQVPDTDTPPESLIALADKALYQAKTNGRNQICGTG